MNAPGAAAAPRPGRIRFARAIALASGAFNLATGLALLLAPRWFFEVVADFPPYNRHFLADAGAFVLAIGLGLVIAARNPAQHRGIIGLAALAGLLHAGNHLVDDVLAGGASLHWLTNTLPLTAQAGLLAAAWWAARRTR